MDTNISPKATGGFGMPNAKSSATQPQNEADRPKEIVNSAIDRTRWRTFVAGPRPTDSDPERLTNARTVNQPKPRKRANSDPPCYVTADQARAIINAARTTPHRLLLEALWQSAGRISEVLRLRPCDLDPHEGALRLHNEKQRSDLNRRKLVYVSPSLVSDLKRLAADNRIPASGYLFRGRQRAQPVSRQYAWELINRYALAAGVLVQTPTGRNRPAHARDFRHGSAVHQIRQGVPLTEIQQQLGHTSIGSTSIYTRLANPERRAMADRVRW